MIVRNGFVRDEDGTWMNMNNIRFFRVLQVHSEDFAVHAVMADRQLVTLTEEFETEHDAACHLDEAMGYDG